MRSVECRSIEATVRPPPTRATAVATRALRWVFFQRASWRRRAARPGRCRDGASDTSAGSPVGVSPGTSAGLPTGARPGAEPAAPPAATPAPRAVAETAAVPVAVSVVRGAVRSGAMSGAYAPQPGHTRAPLRCLRHVEQ
ncbi:hypothetical protein CG719_10750 [Streptomyces sp. CB01373]|nr:hypothetical protein CG719_10750 [Streptomyces sp. CB01373]